MWEIKNTLPGSAGKGSLYFVWTRANESENAPLVAVWIDSKMHAFEVRMEETTERQETGCDPAGKTLEHETQFIVNG